MTPKLKRLTYKLGIYLISISYNILPMPETNIQGQACPPRLTLSHIKDSSIYSFRSLLGSGAGGAEKTALRPSKKASRIWMGHKC
jgi:hypothetical protein